jgi:glucokinase
MADVGAVAVGLDVGGTKVLGVAMDPGTGEVVAEQRVATPMGGAALVDVLAETAKVLSDGDIVAVGVGIAGLVDRRGVLRYSPNLPGIVDLDLPGLLGERLGVPVVVDNDATAATIAEHRLGAGVEVDDLIYVALGTGIGGGVVLDGAVRRGAHGFGGEFGHMIIDPDGPACACGRRGCWEALASGSALGQLARDHVAGGIAPAILAAAGGDVDGVTGEHAVAAAADGDAAALRVLEAYGDKVGMGVAALVAALDPSLVVMGGGVVDAGELVMAPIRAAVSRRILGGAHRPVVPVVAGAFGSRSAAIGAASAAASPR